MAYPTTVMRYYVPASGNNKVIRLYHTHLGRIVVEIFHAHLSAVLEAAAARKYRHPQAVKLSDHMMLGA